MLSLTPQLTALLENLFVIAMLLLSGGYVFRRIYRMGQAHKRKQSACGDCASATCAPPAPAATTGERSLPMR